jgi:hypothetical protein
MVALASVHETTAGAFRVAACSLEAGNRMSAQVNNAASRSLAEKKERRLIVNVFLL